MSVIHQRAVEAALCAGLASAVLLGASACGSSPPTATVSGVAASTQDPTVPAVASSGEAVAGSVTIATDAGSFLKVPETVGDLHPPTPGATLGGAPGGKAGGDETVTTDLYMIFERPDAQDASGAGGYLSVKISEEDPALVATMQSPDAATVAKLLQYPAEQVTLSKIGEREVVTIAASDTVRGEDLGLPDRVTNMRIFLTADKRAVVFVATNVLGEEDVADYISSIEG